ncbi:MAG: hypothetical protein H6747_03535 [Deltaproteobacteria bacterium]|nr:hypothetical protein [Deltaproteobacteria bacterium]
MQLVDKLVIGRRYVLFAKDGHIEGKLVRKDALMVEVQRADGSTVRLGRQQVFAVLEPSARRPASGLRAVS